VIPFRIHPEAARELEEAFEFYNGRADGLGQEFLDEFSRTLDALRSHQRRRPQYWRDRLP